MELKKMFKYEGNNEELFRKQCMDDGYATDAVIIVPDTHNAIVVRDGQAMPTLDSGSHKIFETKKSGLFGLGKPKKLDFTVDVIYMSKTYKLRVPWGTRSKFDFVDSVTDEAFKIGANGEFYVQICNPRKAYLELIGASKLYKVEDLQEYLLNQMLAVINPAISAAMRRNCIRYYEVVEYTKKIEEDVFPELNKMFEEQYGLKLFKFIINKIFISDEDIARLEQARKAMSQEQKDEIKQAREEEKARQKKLEEKADAKEIAAELERLGDKEWEREKWLRELESKDYEKYLEVLKVIGATADAKNPKGAHFCSKCGHSYENGDKFCPGCGKPVGNTKIRCPKCNKEITADAAFCSGCGAKLG